MVESPQASAGTKANRLPADGVVNLSKGIRPCRKGGFLSPLWSRLAPDHPAGDNAREAVLRPTLKVRSRCETRGDGEMLLQSDQPWLAEEQIGGITVVKFNLPEVVDEDTIQTLSTQLYQLVEHGEGLRLVLNLDAVEKL